MSATAPRPHVWPSRGSSVLRERVLLIRHSGGGAESPTVTSVQRFGQRADAADFIPAPILDAVFSRLLQVGFSLGGFFGFFLPIPCQDEVKISKPESMASFPISLASVSLCVHVRCTHTRWPGRRGQTGRSPPGAHRRRDGRGDLAANISETSSKYLGLSGSQTAFARHFSR